MNRRTILKYLSGLLGSGCAAIITFPGVSYLLATVRGDEPKGEISQRVAPLSGLIPGRPFEATITGNHHDAWITSAEEALARVWLVRRSSESVPGAEARVDAYSGLCPHLKCMIQLGPGDERFVCPCHKAAFDFEGERLSEKQLGHRNPSSRGLDRLPCRVVQDDTGEWWVEVTYSDVGESHQA